MVQETLVHIIWRSLPVCVRDTSTVSNPLWYLTINDRIQETLFHIIWRSLPVLSEIHLQYRIHFGI